MKRLVYVLAMMSILSVSALAQTTGALKAGPDLNSSRAASVAIAIIVSMESTMAGPDIQRIYHKETIEGEKALVGYTQITGPRKIKEERQVELVKENGAWHILRFK